MEQRVNDAPRLFDVVAADEKPGVPSQGVLQQTLVGLGELLLLEG